MINPQNQQDIVNNFLLKTDNGKVVEDIIEVPHFGEVFLSPPADAQALMEQIRYPGLATIRPSREGAVMFVTLLMQNKGVTRIVWTPGADYVTVHYAKGFGQNSQKSDDELVDIITNFMKSRANITKLDWELATGEVEIAYVNPAQC